LMAASGVGALSGALYLASRQSVLGLGRVIVAGAFLPRAGLGGLLSPPLLLLSPRPEAGGPAARRVVGVASQTPPSNAARVGRRGSRAWPSWARRPSAASWRERCQTTSACPPPSSPAAPVPAWRPRSSLCASLACERRSGQSTRAPGSFRRLRRGCRLQQN